MSTDLLWMWRFFVFAAPLLHDDPRYTPSSPWKLLRGNSIARNTNSFILLVIRAKTTIVLYVIFFGDGTERVKPRGG